MPYPVQNNMMVQQTGLSRGNVPWSGPIPRLRQDGHTAEGIAQCARSRCPWELLGQTASLGWHGITCQWTGSPRHLSGGTRTAQGSEGCYHYETWLVPMRLWPPIAMVAGAVCSNAMNSEEHRESSTTKWQTSMVLPKETRLTGAHGEMQAHSL